MKKFLSILLFLVIFILFSIQVVLAKCSITGGACSISDLKETNKPINTKKKEMIKPQTIQNNNKKVAQKKR